MEIVLALDVNYRPLFLRRKEGSEMFIRYKFEGKWFYEDQKGCSRSNIDVFCRCEMLRECFDEVQVVDEDNNILY